MSLPYFSELGDKTILSPLPEGADALALAHLAKDAPGGILYVARDDKRMAAIAEEIRFFSPNAYVITLPAWDCLPYDRISPATHITSKRIEALCELAKNGCGRNAIVLTTVNGLLQRLPPAALLAAITFKAKPSDHVKREDLIHHLIRSGYMRSASANEAGEFAVRGSIIDIIPSGSEEGLRLDFFGDELESIRSFDVMTQISGKKRSSIALMPASEVVMDEETIGRFRDKYRELFGHVAGDDPLYDAISEGRHYPGMEHWLPLFYTHLDTLFDYLPDCVVGFDHLAIEARDERLALIADYYDARKGTQDDAFSGSDSYKPLATQLLYLDAMEWDMRLQERKLLFLSPFRIDSTAKTTAFDLPFKTVNNFNAESKTSKRNVFELLSEQLALRLSKHKVIACYSEGTRQRLDNLLKEHNFTTTIANAWEDTIKLKNSSIALVILNLEHGFESDRFILISEQDILGERMGQRKASRKRSDRFLIEASSLSEGELVVHKEHGLGRFVTLETLTISNEYHDCLLVVYDGGDKLYVPVENIEVLSRYGAEDENTRLDKLGSASWQSRKARFKKRIREIAGDLLRVAAERQLKTAPRMIPMEGTYDEFCSRFPYAETEDQLRCIEDVAQDLASGRPMDRLICGDVGFGKTEVALRAAFIAASDHEHMQVAIIAPTTLLVRQHYKTFKERFAGFPFEVRGLSRLTSPKEAKEVKKGLAEGKIDIVVGTHALLAKSIEFKKLGLVIVDEEQQFGVVQKERFKQLRSDIHMLSLSATPIPRTLQMSLTGIKDLSLIATPPVDRLAIRSFTMPFDPVVIRNAILREHYRGGNSFFVVPRIKDLDEIEKKLKTLVPEVKITRAHGQMPPEQLDQTMNEFYDGKYDVLLATNIIGSGLDLPTANTIIVHRADMFGLAQLYQMRGRVGRSKIRAYAYFTIPPKRVPTKTALKRLEVMQNLDSLGAGFTLASHDMDIRGFGNLVGEEQSGQVKEVGIELYQEMLKEAIESVKIQQDTGAESAERWSPHINLGISILIPDTYVSDLELRLGLYRRIANAENNDEIEALASEMIDRFGNLPKEVSNLLDVMKIKQLCHQAGVSKVEAGPKGIVLSFHNNEFKNPEALIAFITKNRATAKLRGDQSIVLKQEWKNADERLKGARSSLENIIKLAA